MFERFSRPLVVDGQNVGRVWSFRDFTERARTEAALQKQSERWRVTLASIGDAVITTDTDGCVSTLNRVAESLTGWTQDEAEGEPLEQVFQIVNEHSRLPVENPASRSLKEGKIVGLANHTLLIARDGSERAIDDSAAPIKDEEGRIIGVVLMFRDVTESRRAVEARLRLSAIVESSNDAIISKTLDGTITSWNHAAEVLYGYTAEEVVGKPLTILLPPDHEDELPTIMDRLKRGEHIMHYETVRKRRDGTHLDVSLTISPIRTADGEIIGASKIARDITAAKQATRRTRFLAEASAALAELTDYREHAAARRRRWPSRFFADWCAVDMLEADGSVRRLAVTHTDPAKVQLAHELSSPLPPAAAGYRRRHESAAQRQDGVDAAPSPGP